ncbi:MAG: acyl carrier protein [Actinophytocola sp.]|uniref:acyl carrier protein n=1 Tax=Actinophytocola sp. TaxID=1872138 RepID=UPI0013251A02|nr:acyl carrier protein [Actinophytocola sp.]MPZ83087.1 acyl carrier protein [Actinophytocola sp.]
MTAIEECITKILLEDFKVRDGSICRDTTLADLGFDSLVIVELALVLDNEFGIALEDGELADSMTITDAAELLVAKGAVC